MKNGEVLERAAQTEEASYTLPNDVTFAAQDCGQENAFYSSSDRTVTMFYEFVSLCYNQYVTSLVDEVAEEETSEEVETADDEESAAE